MNLLHNVYSEVSDDLVQLGFNGLPGATSCLSRPAFNGLAEFAVKCGVGTALAAVAIVTGALTLAFLPIILPAFGGYWLYQKFRK